MHASWLQAACVAWSSVVLCVLFVLLLAALLAAMCDDVLCSPCQQVGVYMLRCTVCRGLGVVDTRIVYDA